MGANVLCFFGVVRFVGHQGHAKSEAKSSYVCSCRDYCDENDFFGFRGVDKQESGKNFSPSN